MCVALLTMFDKCQITDTNSSLLNQDKSSYRVSI
jgi:hypothetical protein